MPKLTTVPQATATTTTQVKIAPKLRKQLLTNLRAYAELAEQLKAIEMAMDKHKGVVGKIRAEIGEDKVSLEGFTVSEVRSTYTKLNKQKFVELGGSLELLENATETIPKKPFEKITCPKAEKDEDQYE